MSPDHPERCEQGFRDYWKKAGSSPSLQCYTDYVQAKEKATHAQAVEAGRKPPRKSAGLQYSDLYGVPTILVLCEKGSKPLGTAVHVSVAPLCVRPAALPVLQCLDCTKRVLSKNDTHYALDTHKQRQAFACNGGYSIT